MNTPNKLTLIRIMLVPFFIFFLLYNKIPHNFLIAGIIFGIASFTDYLDGKIARKYNLVTDFGKFADPLADKILVISAFVCFIEMDIISSVLVVIVLMREFVVTSLRLVAVEKGIVIAANYWGKAKTVSQIIAIIIVILTSYFMQLVDMNIIIVESKELLNNIIPIINKTVLWISTLLCIISGVIYVWDNRECIKNAK